MIERKTYKDKIRDKGISRPKIEVNAKTETNGLREREKRQWQRQKHKQDRNSWGKYRDSLSAKSPNWQSRFQNTDKSPEDRPIGRAGGQAGSYRGICRDVLGIELSDGKSGNGWIKMCCLLTSLTCVFFFLACEMRFYRLSILHLGGYVCIRYLCMYALM